MQYQDSSKLLTLKGYISISNNIQRPQFTILNLDDICKIT